MAVEPRAASAWQDHRVRGWRGLFPRGVYSFSPRADVLRIGTPRAARLGRPLRSQAGGWMFLRGDEDERQGTA